MPTALRNAKGKEKKEDTSAQKEVEEDVSGNSGDSNSNLELQKLVYDYLMAGDMANTVKSFLKDIGSDAKQFKSLSAPEDNLEAVYASYQATKNAPSVASSPKKKKKTTQKKTHDLLSSIEGGEEVESTGDSSKADAAPKKKRKRQTVEKKENGDNDATGQLGDGLGMKEETQKQYTFGWKRYTEYCELRSLNTLVGEGATPSTQILEYARYLMQNPGKVVKPSVANSYVSAVGKKLLDANVITSMKEIRTPQLKELFTEAGRASVASAAGIAGDSSSSVATTTTLATASTSSDNDPKKKARV